jgi:hypothetical protein
MRLKIRSVAFESLIRPNSLQRKDESPIHIRKSTRANPTQLAIYNACNIPSTILKPTITSY